MFVGAHEELVYFICSGTQSPRLWAVFDQIAFVDFNSSNCDGEGQSFPVEYYLEWVEEFSEGINQARGNTRISCTEFDYDERARDCKCMLRSELLA